MRAVAGDPGVPMVGATRRAATNRLASRRYRVIALIASRRERARRAQLDLRATGRRAWVVPTRSGRSTRYVVVTHQRLPLAKSLAQVRVLARFGYRARVGLSR